MYIRELLLPITAQLQRNLGRCLRQSLNAGEASLRSRRHAGQLICSQRSYKFGAAYMAPTRGIDGDAVSHKTRSQVICFTAATSLVVYRRAVRRSKAYIDRLCNDETYNGWLLCGLLLYAFAAALLVGLLLLLLLLLRLRCSTYRI